MYTKQYKVTLEDTFSFAKKTIVIEMGDTQSNKLKQAKKNKQVVWRQVDSGIVWNWVPKKIEEIK